jgi:hypothetical protein
MRGSEHRDYQRDADDFRDMNTRHRPMHETMLLGECEDDFGTEARDSGALGADDESAV